jgi:flagellar motor switch protein FliG
MIKGTDPVHSAISENSPMYVSGIDLRTYIAVHSNIDWSTAQAEFGHAYRRNGSIEEVAELMAEMKVKAADAIIAELNKPTTTA